MTATISKWGNSQGVRLPKEIIQLLELSIGDKVELKREGNKVIIEPIKKKRYDIKELVKMIPDDYNPREELHTQTGMEEW